MQPHTAPACDIMVATPIIYATIWISTNLPTLEGWKAEWTSISKSLPTDQPLIGRRSGEIRRPKTNVWTTELQLPTTLCNTMITLTWPLHQSLMTNFQRTSFWPPKLSHVVYHRHENSRLDYDLQQWNTCSCCVLRHNVTNEQMWKDLLEGLNKYSS